MTLRLRNPFYVEEPKITPMVELSTPVPVFCHRSGDRLEVKQQVSGYYTDTGRPMFEYRLVCPKAKDPDAAYSWSGTLIWRVTCDGSAWAEPKPSPYSYPLTHLDCSERPEGWKPQPYELYNR